MPFSSEHYLHRYLCWLNRYLCWLHRYQCWLHRFYYINSSYVANIYVDYCPFHQNITSIGNLCWLHRYQCWQHRFYYINSSDVANIYVVDYIDIYVQMKRAIPLAFPNIRAVLFLWLIWDLSALIEFECFEPLHSCVS